MHHIMFHADIDGIVSAALFLNQTCGLKGNYKLYPLLSSSRGDKFNSMIEGIKKNCNDSDVESSIIILDFEYHEKANVWIDHHPNKNLGHGSIFNEKIHYDYKSMSTFELVFKYFNKNITNVIFRKNLEGMVNFVNMVDSAKYPSANYVFTNKDPGMLIYSYLETTFHAEMMFCRLVEMLAVNDLDLINVVSKMNITDASHNKLVKKAKEIKKYIEIYGNFTFVRQHRIYQYPRYSENFLFPDIKYNVRVSPGSIREFFHVQISANSWSTEANQFNIGQFINKLSYIKGGGHFNVGGGSLEEKNLDKFLNDFSELVNEKGDVTMEELEKYGVDHEADPIEKKADEMVKTGEAEDKDEARKKAVESEASKSVEESKEIVENEQ